MDVVTKRENIDQEDLIRSLFILKVWTFNTCEFRVYNWHYDTRCKGEVPERSHKFTFSNLTKETMSNSSSTH